MSAPGLEVLGKPQSHPKAVYMSQMEERERKRPPSNRRLQLFQNCVKYWSSKKGRRQKEME